MDASVRPWFGKGVAFVGASAIMMAPISPITPSALASVPDVRASVRTISPEIQLAALDLPYILTLPIVRQSVKNWAANWAVYLAGFGKAGAGAVESLLAIPGVTREIIQEVFALNFVGAFNTFTAAIRDSAVAIGEPLLDSLIWRNQKYSVVQTALDSAMPQAFLDVVNGFLYAGNVVVTSLIQGVQDLVGAVLSLNLGNIVDAVIDGTRNFFLAVGEGAGSIVDGIEAAQLGITTALATAPPPSPFSTSGLPSADSTAGLVGTQAVAGRNSVTLTLAQPGSDISEPVVVEDLPAPDDEVITSPADVAGATEPLEAEIDDVDSSSVDTVGVSSPDRDVDEPAEDETTPKDALSDDGEAAVTKTVATAPKGETPTAGSGADGGPGSKGSDAATDTKKDAAA